jgi:hypothetical protein
MECDDNVSSNRLQKVWEGLLLSPHSRWFALIGAINRDKHPQFEVGTERTLVCHRTESSPALCKR